MRAVDWYSCESVGAETSSVSPLNLKDDLSLCRCVGGPVVAERIVELVLVLVLLLLLLLFSLQRTNSTYCGGGSRKGKSYVLKMVAVKVALLLLLLLFDVVVGVEPPFFWDPFLCVDDAADGTMRACQPPPLSVMYLRNHTVKQDHTWCAFQYAVACWQRRNRSMCSVVCRMVKKDK
jgi:hypothetical protein